MKNRKQKLFWINLSLALALGIIVVVGVLYWKDNRYSTYENTQHNFSIKAPLNWSITENVNGAVVLFYAPLESEFDIFQENINIVVQDISRNKMDIREYSELAIRQMEMVFKDKLEMVESEPTYLDGKPAYKYVFVGSGLDGDLKYKSVWTLDGYTAYQVTYTSMAGSYDKYIKKVDKMIKSFRIQN